MLRYDWKEETSVKIGIGDGQGWCERRPIANRKWIRMLRYDWKEETSVKIGIGDGQG
jgi:hypothetical protein